MKIWMAGWKIFAFYICIIHDISLCTLHMLGRQYIFVKEISMADKKANAL